MGGGDFISHRGLYPASTILSTWEICTTSSCPPQILGMASFTSIMTVSALSIMAFETPSAPERLKYPCLSIGAAETIATSTLRKFL